MSVRRFDMTFSVLLGWRYLKEKNIRYRLIGSLIMTSGVIALLLA